MELTNTTTTILQYSDTVEGSLLTISCLEGYYLPGGDMMSVCANGSWSPNPLNTVCVPEGRTCQHSMCVFPAIMYTCYSRDNLRHGPYYNSDSRHCVQSSIFDCWGCGGSSECPHQKWIKEKVAHFPLSPSPLPTATYEEVGVANEKSHDIQLTSNESYAVNILQKDIPTSHNSAYGVV